MKVPDSKIRERSLSKVICKIRVCFTLAIIAFLILMPIVNDTAIVSKIDLLKEEKKAIRGYNYNYTDKSLISTLGLNNREMNKKKSINPDILEVNSSLYTPHGPIIINNDTAFELYNFPGKGTKDDPYRIEYLNITNTEVVDLTLNQQDEQKG